MATIFCNFSLKKLPIGIPVSDLREGVNTIDLVITGNEGSKPSNEVKLPLFAEILHVLNCVAVAPKCKMSTSGSVITISCKESSVEIAYYKYYINSLREEVGSGQLSGVIAGTKVGCNSLHFVRSRSLHRN